MASVNKVILVGNLGKDPEVRTTQSGSVVCTMSVATSDRWKDRHGEQQEKTEWHRVVIWNEVLAKLAEKYLKKGSKVYLEGAMQTRKYTDGNGVERYTTEVVLGQYKSTLVLLDTQERQERSDGRQASRPAEKRAPQDGWGDTGGDLDDEIPF